MYYTIIYHIILYHIDIAPASQGPDGPLGVRKVLCLRGSIYIYIYIYIYNTSASSGGLWRFLWAFLRGIVVAHQCFSSGFPALQVKGRLWFGRFGHEFSGLPSIGVVEDCQGLVGI